MNSKPEIMLDGSHVLPRYKIVSHRRGAYFTLKRKRAFWFFYWTMRFKDTYVPVRFETLDLAKEMVERLIRVDEKELWESETERSDNDFKLWP